MVLWSCLTRKMETTANSFSVENLMARTMHRCGAAEMSKGKRVRNLFADFPPSSLLFRSKFIPYGNNFLVLIGSIIKPLQADLGGARALTNLIGL